MLCSRLLLTFFLVFTKNYQQNMCDRTVPYFSVFAMYCGLSTVLGKHRLHSTLPYIHLNPATYSLKLVNYKLVLAVIDY